MTNSGYDVNSVWVWCHWSFLQYRWESWGYSHRYSTSKTLENDKQKHFWGKYCLPFLSPLDILYMSFCCYTFFSFKKKKFFALVNMKQSFWVKCNLSIKKTKGLFTQIIITATEKISMSVDCGRVLLSYPSQFKYIILATKAAVGQTSQDLCLNK